MYKLNIDTNYLPRTEADVCNLVFWDLEHLALGTHNVTIYFHDVEVTREVYLLVLRALAGKNCGNFRHDGNTIRFDLHVWR